MVTMPPVMMMMSMPVMIMSMLVVSVSAMLMIGITGTVVVRLFRMMMMIFSLTGVVHAGGIVRFWG
jgi:hypothetical protein